MSSVFEIQRRITRWKVDQTFRRDISASSSGLKSKPSKKPALGRQKWKGSSLFNREGEGDMFSRNVGWL
jgi:hypothetical protein